MLQINDLIETIKHFLSSNKCLQNMNDFVVNVKEKISKNDEFDDQFKKLIEFDDFYMLLMNEMNFNQKLLPVNELTFNFYKHI